MSLQRIENAQVKDARVLLLMELDPPSGNQPARLGDARKRQLLASAELLLSRGAHLTLAAHAGIHEPEKGARHSLEHLTDELATLLGKSVKFLKDPLRSDRNAIDSSDGTEILLMENLLKYPEELSHSKSYAQQWNNLFTLVVNDSSSSSVRPFWSSTVLPGLIDSAPGVHLFQEMEVIRSYMNRSGPPVVLILGGVHLEQKIALVRKFFTLPTARPAAILLGGGIAYTFMKSRVRKVGKSFVESALEVDAFQLIEKSELNETELLMPLDHIATQDPGPRGKTKAIKQQDIPDEWIGMDIGEKTISRYEKLLKSAQSVLWYGPLGKIEYPAYQRGTEAIAKSLSRLKCRTVAVGRELSEFLEETKLDEKISHVSPHSECFVKMILGEKVPGYHALMGELS